jgi:hypothetical protein
VRGGRDLPIYPAESRLSDTSNKYHLWCFADPTHRLPFGLQGRRAMPPYAPSTRTRTRPCAACRPFPLQALGGTPFQRCGQVGSQVPGNAGQDPKRWMLWEPETRYCSRALQWGDLKRLGRRRRGSERRTLLSCLACRSARTERERHKPCRGFGNVRDVLASARERVGGGAPTSRSARQGGPDVTTLPELHRCRL